MHENVFLEQATNLQRSRAEQTVKFDFQVVSKLNLLNHKSCGSIEMTDLTWQGNLSGLNTYNCDMKAIYARIFR